MNKESIDKSGIKHFSSDILGIDDAEVCSTCEFFPEEQFIKVEVNYSHSSLLKQTGTHIGVMREPTKGAGEYQILASNGVIFYAHESKLKEYLILIYCNISLKGV